MSNNVPNAFDKTINLLLVKPKQDLVRVQSKLSKQTEGS